jgi:hypothetical protein
MATRDIYLQIEPIYEYTPVEPDPMASPPLQYRRDCMRNPGHEDGTIPASEVDARRLTALVYREYLDADSAAVNCQPRKIQRTIPISKTRFVEANWKAIAAARLAPFWNIDLAIATAA